jgi:hypothetical protein
MSVRFEAGAIRFGADCPVEDAEMLAGLLAEHRSAVVDVTACISMHGAVLQALLSFAPKLRGAFADDFLNLWVFPALAETSRQDLMEKL